VVETRAVVSGSTVYAQRSWKIAWNTCRFMLVTVGASDGVRMASRKARKRFHKRDRRKAKESGYARAPKGNPKRVGHGTSGSVQHPSTAPSSPKPVIPPERIKGAKTPKGEWHENIGQPPLRGQSSSFGAKLVELVDDDLLEQLADK
jgi:hypothetical protein